MRSWTEVSTDRLNMCTSVKVWLNLPLWVQTTSVFDLQLYRWETICQLVPLSAAGNPPLLCCDAATHRALLSPQGKHPWSWCLDIYVTTMSAQRSQVTRDTACREQRQLGLESDFRCQSKRLRLQQPSWHTHTHTLLIRSVINAGWLHQETE